MNKIIYIALIISLLCSCSKNERTMSVKEVKVAFIIDGNTKLNQSSENIFVDLSIFQFNHSSGTLVKKEYIPSFIEYQPVSFLTPPDGILDVYFIANLGDQTTKYTEGSTNRIEIDTSTFAIPNTGKWSFIPMSGKHIESTSVNTICATMSRAMAKVSIIAKSSIKTDSTELIIGEITMRGIPSRGRIFCSNDTLPDENVTYINYIKKNVSLGDTVIWYVPENIQGINAAITDYEEKNIHTMPSANCSRITIATGYRHHHLYDYGETDIIIGGTNCTDFNVMRNTHYYYNVMISNISDSRINWMSLNNAIPYIENGINYGNGIYFGNGIWAPINYGTDVDNPFGKYCYLDGYGMPSSLASIDPCPTGWRIPQIKNFNFLTYGEHRYKTKYYWEWDNGFTYISNHLVVDTLHFPARGYMIKNFDIIFEPEKCFYLYTSNNYPYKRVMAFDRITVSELPDSRNNMYTNIRCVLDNQEYQRSFYPLNY